MLKNSYCPGCEEGWQYFEMNCLQASQFCDKNKSEVLTKYDMDFVVNVFGVVQEDEICKKPLLSIRA